MKQKIIVLAMAGLLVTISGCSSTKDTGSLSSGTGIEPGSNASVPIAEQRLATSEFKRSGVKIIYSLTGNVEAIEVTGYAPAWGGSHKSAREAFRAAELEAKKSLSDFIHKETITSRASVDMITANLEHAQDNTANKFATNKPAKNNGELVATDEDVGTTANENQAVRNNAVKMATNMRTTIVSSNRGIISGLYLKESQVIDDGKAVKVVMRWDKKNNPVRLQIGKMMAM
jgi:hypothetical protein